MNWYKYSQQVYLGYKIVGVEASTKRAYSIYDKSDVNISIGSIVNYGNSGLFLGTSKQFCIDYYSCGTADEDGELLLTYRFNDTDLLKGDPNYKNGEVQVRQATLIDFDNIDKNELC